MKSARILMPLIVMMIAALTFAAEVPTMEEIQQSFTGGKYQDVIRQVQQVLPLANNPAKGYDKGKLLNLRAESLLQLKQYSPASDSFVAAAKEKTTDPQTADLDNATATLIRHSPGGVYTPKQPSTNPADASKPGGKASPVNIVDAKTRKEAFVAMFNDESVTLKPKIAALKNVTSLTPLMNGMKQVGDIRAIEVAGTGSDSTTKAMLSELSEQAGKLIGNAISQMTMQVENIAKLANQTTMSSNAYGNPNSGVISKRGLVSTDKDTLNNIINTAKQIEQACDQIGGTSTGKDNPMAESKAAAVKLDARATEVLNADYNPIVNGIPQGPSGQQPQRPNHPPGG